MTAQQPDPKRAKDRGEKTLREQTAQFSQAAGQAATAGRTPTAGQRARDPRVNARYPVWLEYALIWLVMLCLTGGQALILASYTDFGSFEIPPAFIGANIGYWGMMTFIYCLVNRALRRRAARGMKRLSAAARQVAAGDFDVHIMPLRRDGKKDEVEVTFDDFNTMVEELSTIETMKTDFIANVSHEIKTPLAVIQNYASALRMEDISSEQRREYTETISLAATKLNVLVADILRLSKLENQRIVPRLERFDLCGQLAACALAFAERLEAKRISFSAEIDDRVMVRADQSMLEIVWNNLLSNAIKFTDAGGKIALRLSSDADTVTVTLSDTGCGMDEATLTRIFDKFYQGDSSHAQEGNGLGLALTLRVVELSGGQITARSELGQGSSFTVRLRRDAEQDAGTFPHS